jgi:hypothetical protein
LSAADYRGGAKSAFGIEIELKRERKCMADDVLSVNVNTAEELQSFGELEKPAPAAMGKEKG